MVASCRLLEQEIKTKSIIKTSLHSTATGHKLHRVTLICEEWNLYVHLNNLSEIQPVVAVVRSSLHSLCGTAGQRAVALAGPALAEPPASTGRASRGRWSPCCPTHTQAPTSAAESSLWISRSTCRCPCSTRPTAMARPFTSLTIATTMLPWPHITTVIRKRTRLRRCSSLYMCYWFICPDEKSIDVRLFKWLMLKSQGKGILMVSLISCLNELIKELVLVCSKVQKLLLIISWRHKFQP